MNKLKGTQLPLAGLQHSFRSVPCGRLELGMEIEYGSADTYGWNDRQKACLAPKGYGIIESLVYDSFTCLVFLVGGSLLLLNAEEDYMVSTEKRESVVEKFGVWQPQYLPRD